MPTLIIEATSLIRNNQNNHNSVVFVDMMHDMQQMRDGVYSCTLRINDGYITDYVLMDNNDKSSPPAIHKPS